MTKAFKQEVVEVTKGNNIQMVPHETLPVAQSEEGQFMNLIAEMMRDKDADMGKLEKLLALRDQEKAARAKAAYDEAFAKMKPHLPKVMKTHFNKQTNSNYAKLGDINAEIDPILGRYGFGSSMKIISQTESDVTVMTRVTHKMGHSEETTIIMPLDNKGPNGKINKTAPHALLSAIEYAKRGGLSALLNISTGDDKDGNTEDGGLITIEQAAEIDKRLRAIDGDGAVGRFLKWGKIEKIIDLPASKHSAALKALAVTEAEAKARRAK